MAAGAKACVHKGQAGGLLIEEWQITTNGTNAVTLYPAMRRVISVQATWGADIGATGHVAECTVDNTTTPGTPTVAVTASGAISKDAFITVKGF